MARAFCGFTVACSLLWVWQMFRATVARPQARRAKGETKVNRATLRPGRATGARNICQTPMKKGGEITLAVQLTRPYNSTSALLPIRGRALQSAHGPPSGQPFGLPARRRWLARTSSKTVSDPRNTPLGETELALRRLSGRPVWSCCLQSRA
jgi:hypothetical protein